jgi:hypothetical protein
MSDVRQRFSTRNLSAGGVAVATAAAVGVGAFAAAPAQAAPHQYFPGGCVSPQSNQPGTERENVSIKNSTWAGSAVGCTGGGTGEGYACNGFKSSAGLSSYTCAGNADTWIHDTYRAATDYSLHVFARLCKECGPMSKWVYKPHHMVGSSSVV